MYCVRSFVPIEKKSTSFARTSAIIAAAGVSTIIPTLISASYLISFLSRSLHIPAIIFLTAFISVTEVIIGIIILILP